MCVVAFGKMVVSLLGNINDYAGRGIVSIGAGVERIGVWACL